jgi:hypothetical protein
MKIFEGTLATGKRRKITCTGCGKRAEEAGFAVPDSAVEYDYDPGGEGPPMVAEIEISEAEPLCEACVTKLLREQTESENSQLHSQLH